MLFFSREKPKIKENTSKKKEGFDGFSKCSGCQELIHNSQLQQNLSCCPKCNYHYRLSAEERIQHMADSKSFKVLFDHLTPTDPLRFKDQEPYADRLEKAKAKSGTNEAVICGRCLIEGKSVALGVMDFQFMGGSMGSVVGERLTLLIEYALSHELPVVIVATSGGARMQESIFSLMQMAKISAALAKLHEKGLAFISVLLNPTSGGVTASFASLGDIIIAEPGALICFAGPRVIEQTIGHKLPAGAQMSEFLLEHGMIDCIAKRSEIKKKVATFLDYLSGNEKKNLKTAKQKEAEPAYPRFATKA